MESNPFDLTKKTFKSWAQKHHADDKHVYTIDGAVVADDLIRYETIESDVERVCNIVGGHPPGDLPRLKGGHRVRPEHYSHYYDNECQEIVEGYFEFELREFGYRFEVED